MERVWFCLLATSAGFLLGLFSGPEDGGNVLLQNFFPLSTD
jgi:hypothetical protein